MKRASVLPQIASIYGANWPFLNIRITSKPLIVAKAVFIDWRPSVGPETEGDSRAHAPARRA
jgi:hypothetical protein